MPETPFIIAEMACSHDGSLDHAKTIVDAAAAAEANAIQIQVWTPGEVITPTHPDCELLQRIELSRAEWIELLSYIRSESSGLEVIACVYGVESIRFLADQGIQNFKIHTSDLTNPVLLSETARCARRIDLSVGGSTHEEVVTSLEILRNHHAREIWLMWGLQLFPTPETDVNIHGMLALGKEFNLRIGYQDHSDPESPAAYVMPAIAVTAGIDVIEKHLTHDRSLRGVDHQAALNPDEFAGFTRLMRTCGRASTNQCSIFDLTESATKYREYSKKQVMLAYDVPAGHEISAADLVFLRGDTFVANGYQPANADAVIGKRVATNLSAYTVLTPELFK